MLHSFPMGVAEFLSGYNISNAALFDGSTGYLSKTLGSSGTDTWTFSAWVLKDKIAGNYPHIFASGSDMMGFFNDDTFRTYSGANVFSAGKYRDTSAFMHVCVSSASGVVTVEINGVDISFGTTAYTAINSAVLHTIGVSTDTVNYDFSGYMAEIHFVDGQALAATDFGETDTKTGNWIAKKYTGTYGTNGFYLDFSNSGALGTDASGNGNNWTVNGTVTQVTSTPTNVAATLSPLNGGTTATLSNGNLSMTAGTSASHRSAGATLRIPSSGKFGWRVNPAKNVNNESIGLAQIDASNPQLPAAGFEIGFRAGVNDYIYRSNGVKANANTSTAYGATWTNANYIHVGCDVDAGTIEFFKDGVSQGTAFTGVDFTQMLVPANSQAETTTTTYDFTDAPAGYLTLTTDNLPAQTATEKDLSKHWNTVLYTGDGVNGRSVDSGLPDCDFVWIKHRTTTYNHNLYDTIRGANARLTSQDVLAEQTNYLHGYLSAFNGDGTFNVTSGTTSIGDVNNNGASYVTWCASLPNTKTTGWAGSPTITPSKEIYNTDLGMSIVTYTGNGTAGATIPHSLGKKPGMIIVKNLNTSLWNWMVYHSSLGATKYFSGLNTTNAAVTGSAVWNNNEPTSTVFTVDGTGGNQAVNGSGDTYVAYIFAESDFIKIGSYIGNGSADGPMVNTGTSTEFGFVKVSSGTTNDWCMFDSQRPGYTPMDNLRANLSAAEDTTQYDADALANGLKLRNLTNGMNGTGHTYIYMTIGQPNSPSENTGR